MNARSWTSWCSAAALIGSAPAADTPAASTAKPVEPIVINYSMADSSLPVPAFFKKPAAVKADPAASTPAKKPEAATPGAVVAQPVPSTAPAAAPSATTTESMGTPPVAKSPAAAPTIVVAGPARQPVAPPAAPSPLAATPTEVARTQTPAVEAAVMKPCAAPTSPILPAAAYAPIPDDYTRCIECLKVLSGSPIESDRRTALRELGTRSAWKHMKSSYMILRRIALTEYNTKMRAEAVVLLGEAMMEHALAADTLKLSAQYDSDGAIRTAALAQLERLAALPPDRVTR